jgi:hypothetical protein
MPWALHSLNSSEPLSKRTYYLTRKKITVGRKENDGNDVVVNKKSVSRKHATIWITETSFNVRNLESRPSIEMEDHSTFGTSINGINVNKTRKGLRDGDTIQFAKSQTMYRLQFVPIVICVTGIGSSKRKDALRKMLRKLGVHYQSSWGERVTHLLTERPLTITVKFLRALLCGIPVINREWIERIIARAQLDDPLPQESQCLLSLDGGARKFEATGQVESMYSVKRERKSLFKQCSFVFVSHSEFVWMVRAGGGHAYEFHKMSKSEIDDVFLRAEKSESSRNWFFVQPFTNLSSQRRGETQQSQQESDLSRTWYNRMMKFKANEVGEDTLGQCIVSCKTSMLFGKTESSTTMLIKQSEPTIGTSSTDSLSNTSAAAATTSLSSSTIVKPFTTAVPEVVTPSKQVLSPKETPSKWSTMSYNQLRKELKKRGIKASGKKINLLKRLEEFANDKKKEEKSISKEEKSIPKEKKSISKEGEEEDKEEKSRSSKKRKIDVVEERATKKKKEEEEEKIHKEVAQKRVRNKRKNKQREDENFENQTKKRVINNKIPSPKKKKKKIKSPKKITNEMDEENDDGWFCPRKKKAKTQTQGENNDEDDDDEEEEEEELQQDEDVDESVVSTSQEKEENENAPPSPRPDLSGMWISKKKKKKKKKNDTTTEECAKAVVESRKMIVKQNHPKKSRKKSKNNNKDFKRFRKNSIPSPCTTPISFSLPIVPNETQEERERRRLFEDDIMAEKRADMVWDLDDKRTKKKKKRRK